MHHLKIFCLTICLYHCSCLKHRHPLILKVPHNSPCSFPQILISPERHYIFYASKTPAFIISQTLVVMKLSCLPETDWTTKHQMDIIFKHAVQSELPFPLRSIARGLFFFHYHSVQNLAAVFFLDSCVSLLCFQQNLRFRCANWFARNYYNFCNLCALLQSLVCGMSKHLAI